MLIAAIRLRVKDGFVTPGSVVPGAETWPRHVLKAHLDQGKIVEGDAARASAMAEAYAEKVAKDEAVGASLTLQQARDSLTAVRAEIVELKAKTAEAEKKAARCQAKIDSLDLTKTSEPKAKAGKTPDPVEVSAPVAVVPVPVSAAKGKGKKDKASEAAPVAKSKKDTFAGL